MITHPPSKYQPDFKPTPTKTPCLKPTNYVIISIIMNIPKHLSYIILLSLLIIGNAHAQVLIDSIIAVVNKQAITQSELVDEFRIEEIINNPLKKKPSETDKRIYLDRLIIRRFVLQGAEKIGITTADYKKQVAARIAEIRTKFPSDKVFQDLLQKQKLEIATLEKWVYEQIIYDTYYNRQFVNRVDSRKIDELAPQYFEANKTKYVVPATVTFRSILIAFPLEGSEEQKQATKRIAEQINSHLQSGETYEKIEQNNETNPSISFDTLTLTTDTPLGEIVAQLEPTERKGPISVSEGYRIVELIKKTDARQKQYSEVKDEIATMLRQNKAETEFNQWLAKQKAGVPWYIINDSLKRVTQIQIQPTK